SVNNSFYIISFNGVIFIESRDNTLVLFISNITELSYVLISQSDITGCMSMVARPVTDSVSFGAILL
ncbi:hypothetical protein NX067_17875, partial [Salmonella enterica subsp. enterica serovar Typhi]|uniref:hypothetical protein n=1 Tax=Salmonella enterica TaxID=28901 RepID=UPI002D1E4F1D